ncbi:MAG TPA: sulfatase-like hydrolase/transferase [Chitinophagaceae bacterium]|jgi:hypothetical protein|nr:sulfatase-like hydrolase/transferase [Chitinophagaceae bacterium]
MKNILVSVFLLSAVPFSPPSANKPAGPAPPPATSENLFIITIDGFRWQEVFTGADSALLCNENYTADPEYMKMLYWADDPEERRKRLLPFFWNILAVKGQLYGNRHFDNRFNNANVYSISYPGYNEIFTGMADLGISSNDKNRNPNLNVLEYLNDQPSFKGKVAAFSSWDVFPYILNQERNHLLINSGYMQEHSTHSPEQQMISDVQEKAVYEKTATRYDELTFLTAKEYIKEHRPRVAFIGLGETDEFAHQGRYDLYLEQAAKTDKMIAELWHWVQTTPGYRNNTTFLITTDHGRGSKRSGWSSHGSFIKGSSQTWMALIGPGINALGEVKEDQQYYQSQLAQTIAALLGEEFVNTGIAPAISLR